MTKQDDFLNSPLFNRGFGGLALPVTDTTLPEVKVQWLAVDFGPEELPVVVMDNNTVMVFSCLEELEELTNTLIGAARAIRRKEAK